jgi:pimeloyl-ACP methyl ester carboxylesterase
MTAPCTPLFLSSPAFGGLSANQIAYKRTDVDGNVDAPGLIWCGGLKSDMEGGKATTLHDWAEKQKRAFIRFDYFGHGASTGRFRDGTITRWAADTRQIIDQVAKGPQILIGSSMGAWTSLLAALARPDRIKALLLIAPAPDFSEKLMWAEFDEKIRTTIMEEGIYLQPSDYDEPYEISRDLILDGRKNLLMDGMIDFKGPVRILQGMQDTSVPWTHAQKLVDLLVSENVEMTLVKDGDHSLSEPQDLDRLIRTVKELCRLV